MFILFVIYIFSYLIFAFSLNLNEIILNVKPKDLKDNINLHGHVSFDKGAGKAVGEGLNTIATQLVLGATKAAAGASYAVAKSIAKSSVPLVQKSEIMLGAGILAG